MLNCQNLQRHHTTLTGVIFLRSGAVLLKVVNGLTPICMITGDIVFCTQFNVEIALAVTAAYKCAKFIPKVFRPSGARPGTKGRCNQLLKRYCLRETASNAHAHRQNYSFTLFVVSVGLRVCAALPISWFYRAAIPHAGRLARVEAVSAGRPQNCIKYVT